MSRYQRLNGDDPDDDAVALMQNQVPPRLAKFGAVDYVQLSNLDPAGEELPNERSQQVHRAFVENHRKMRRLMLHVFGLVFFLIIGTMLAVGLVQRRHAASAAPAVLSAPLARNTRLSNGTHMFGRTTLVVSLDGMHPHYLSADRTPHLHKLVHRGFAPPFVTPSFPTQTFPNHWTLVTGNYPINHGIVGNTFYDPELDLEFVNTDPTKSRNQRFWGGEPIWATASRHNLSTAVHMWPGSEADWGDQAPAEYSRFDGDEPLADKAEHIIGWLNRESPPPLMLAYVPNIDQVAHRTGIAGPALQAELMAVDAFVGEIVEALASRNLTNVVNLVVLSDHGMAPTNDARVVVLDKIIENYGNVTSNRGWPLAGLRFADPAQVDVALTSANRVRHGGYTAYASDDLPAVWNFRTTELEGPGGKKLGIGRYAHRLAPMYVVPDVTYSLVTQREWDDMGHVYNLKGVHGYDSQHPLMRALFLAEGPAFPGGKYHTFPNTDVYSALCRSLGIPPSQSSDGDFRGVPLMKKLGKEKYPGEASVTDYFRDSSFDEYYT